MLYFDQFWSEVSGLHPLNLGIGGDRIQNLLWRIQNGALNEIQPKVRKFYFYFIILITCE